MTFESFSNQVMISMEDICRDIFQAHQDTIKVKKEAVGIKNLINIYNATLKLSNDKGFHAMTLRDLAKETGLSLGALYSYFSSKEQLLGIIQEQGYQLTSRILTGALEGVTTPEKRLSTAIRTHIYLSETMQPWFYFFYMEAKHLGKEDQKKAITSELYTEQLYTGILEQGVKTGAFRSHNTLLTASVIKAMLQDWYLKRWKYSRRKVGVDAYADFVCDVVNTYVKP